MSCYLERVSRIVSGYPAIHKILLVLAVALSAIGCAAAKPPVSKPYRRCIDAIQSGQIYPGQSVIELLERSDPLVMTRAGRFKSFHYNPIPGYDGVTVVTKDEHVARAFSWNDYSEPRVFFDTMTDEDRKEWEEAGRWDK
jgi:hypothetical protein